MDQTTRDDAEDRAAVRKLVIAERVQQAKEYVGNLAEVGAPIDVGVVRVQMVYDDGSYFMAELHPAP